MKYHKITPVNPSSAKNLRAKRETWWTTGPNSAQLKLWDVVQGNPLATPQVITQHGVQIAAPSADHSSMTGAFPVCQE